jgi:hypothetical protein
MEDVTSTTATTATRVLKVHDLPPGAVFLGKFFILQ